LGFVFILKDKRKIGFSLILISFLTFSLEGTKSSLLIWSIPMFIFYFFIKPINRKIIYSLGIFVLVGTIWLSTVEAHLDFRVGFKEKLIDRIFLAPTLVSATHYYLTQDEHFYGATNSIVMTIRGGETEVLRGKGLYFDNYVMRYYRTNILSESAGTYGSMNGPAFIYGWDDFGLVGVVFISVLLIGSLILLDKWLKEGYLSKVFLVMVFWLIIQVLTSDSYWNVFFGMEGITMLILLDLLLMKSRPLRATVTQWMFMFFAGLYNVFNYVVRFIS